MKAVKTRYKSGRLIDCSIDKSGQCPLEEMCEYWSLRKETCEWPDKQDEADLMAIPW